MEEEEEEARTRFGKKGETAGCDEWGSILSHSVRVSDYEVETEANIFTVEGVYRSFYSLYIVSNVNSSIAWSMFPVQEGEFERGKVFDGQGNLISLFLNAFRF